MYVISVSLLVFSGVLYQLFQKLISPTVNPALSLMCSYIAALLFTLVLMLFIPLKGSLGHEIRNINIYSFILAVPIIGIELGYLLLYRAGGKLSYSSALVSSMITILLVIVGIIAFQEKINSKKILGIVMCLSGIALLNLE